MDKMSLLSILAVSVPEEILSIYLCFLITGEKTHLYLDDAINIIRLVTAVFFTVLSLVLIRAYLPNFGWVILINMAVVAVILKFTYKIKWEKAAINALVFYIALVSIEIAYSPIFFNITGITLDQLLASDIWRIIYSIPERGIQLFLIISLWNWNKILFNIKEYKELRSAFFIFIIILLGIEIVFFLIFMKNFSYIVGPMRWLYISGFSLFSVLNFLFLRLLSVFANAITKKELNEYMSYKLETKKFLSHIDVLLEQGETEKVKILCKKYIS